jgi:hypothetical protein
MQLFFSNVFIKSTHHIGCQVDIVLLVDMSGGALNKRERYLALASELVRALDIGEFAAKMALVRYSGKGRTDTVFRLKNKFNQTVLLNGYQISKYFYPDIWGEEAWGVGCRAVQPFPFLPFAHKYTKLWT